MKPMLAHVWEPHRVTFPCYVQPKFNGLRAVCGTDEQGRRRFQSRDELPWAYPVLQHISESLDFLPKDLVLDGELYVHGWSLQRIASACTVVRGQPTEDTLSIVFMVFDVVDYTKTFVQREAIMDSLVAGTEMPWRIAKTYIALDAPMADGIYSHLIEAGYEGIMYRLGDCPYTMPKQETRMLHLSPTAHVRTKFLSDKNNRTWHLLKRKSWLDGEFMCIGVEEGIGKRQGKAGALICVAGKGQFKVGSGYSDYDATSFLHFPNDVVGKMIKVKYQTLTADGIPFHPTFEQLL